MTILYIEGMDSNKKYFYDNEFFPLDIPCVSSYSHFISFDMFAQVQKTDENPWLMLGFQETLLGCSSEMPGNI